MVKYEDAALEDARVLEELQRLAMAGAAPRVQQAYAVSLRQARDAAMAQQKAVNYGMGGGPAGRGEAAAAAEVAPYHRADFILEPDPLDVAIASALAHAEAEYAREAARRVAQAGEGGEALQRRQPEVAGGASPRVERVQGGGGGTVGTGAGVPGAGDGTGGRVGNTTKANDVSEEWWPYDPNGPIGDGDRTYQHRFTGGLPALPGTAEKGD